MVEASMTLRLLFALLLTAMLPSLALAQDDTQNQTDTEQAQPQADDAAPAEPADPIDAVQGLWHVDQAQGSAANDTMTGGILKIDRQSITSLTGGTCANPTFSVVPGDADAVAPDAAGPAGLPEVVGIECLGQLLAAATWNPAEPDTVGWMEPNLDVVLHRVKTPATAQQPASTDSGNDSSGGGDSGGDENAE
jgi:hypothetical protein